MFNNLKLRLHEFANWEYWPAWAVYGPLAPIWLWFSLRSGSFYFFSAANPKFDNGGMAMESKKAIYDLIPENLYPKTILIQSDDPLSKLCNKVMESGISFPAILKPDIGMKAFSVKIANSLEDIILYQENPRVHFLVQEYINLPIEVGVFYHRIPGSKKGHVTGVVSKEFLKVVGNGTNSIEELLVMSYRNARQIGSLKKMHGNSLLSVPLSGEEIVLVPFGSHTRGARFIDVSSKFRSESFLEKLDEMMSKVEGFYFGRLDIRCSSLEKLEQWEDFSIIEINGAGSEPTHMYDPDYSILHGWKEIIKHWNILWRISSINHKSGHPYLTFSEGRMMLRDHRIHQEKIREIV